MPSSNLMEENDGSTNVSDKFDENTSFENDINDKKTLVNKLINKSFIDKKSSLTLDDSVYSCQKIRNKVDEYVKSQNVVKTTEMQNNTTKNEENKSKIPDTVDSNNHESYTVFEIYEDKIISKTIFYNSSCRR